MAELKIFVYGTLKVGGRLSKPFDGVRTSVKVGKIKGTLYDLGSFPGVKLEGDYIITGEVHTYTDSILIEKALDRIEGFIKDGHPSNLYNKRQIQVETDAGVEKCLVYEFAKSIDTLNKIEEGIWKI
jgi:gamma-glutamylcyclotransferase (GGCT)/AIG2-like uncharacterized protein YtfP